MPYVNIWVVLPTHNRLQLLRESLQALQHQTRPPNGILVVLNASPPEVRAMLEDEFPQVERLELSQNLGSAGGFHYGIKHVVESGADFIWLMDDDGIARPDALEKLCEAEKATSLLAGEADILLCRVVWIDGSLHPMNFPWPDWRKPKLLLKALNRGWLSVRSGAWTGMLVRSSAVKRHGLPFKDYFVWCEDLDFSGRVLRRGLGYWVHDSVVVHKTAKPAAPANAQGERFFYEVRNRIWLIRSDAFGFWGKIAWGLHTLGEIALYLWSTPRSGLSVVWKGVKAGLSTRPQS